MNEDGKPDVLGTTLSRLGVQILLGNGDGTFTDAPDVEVDPTDFVRAADLDADGHVDVVAAGERIAVLMGNGDGTVRKAAYYEAGEHNRAAELNLFGIDIADLNGDKILDLAAANWGAGRLAVLLGKGDGIFAPASLVECIYCIQVKAGDLDADGDPDLATTSFYPGEPGAVFTFKNAGQAAFAAPVSYDDGCAHAIVLADVDGDGALDAVTANDHCHVASVLLGHGDGTFTEAAKFPVGNAHSVAVADLDRDGKLDLLATSIDDLKVWFLRGLGDGTFRETQGIAAGTAGYVAVTDLDGDGDLDFVLGNAGTDQQVITPYLQQ